MNNLFNLFGKRTTYVINPRFQLTMLLFFMIISAFIIATTYLFISFVFYKFNEYGTQVGFSANDPYFVLIIKQKVMINKFFTYFSIGCFFLVNLLGIIISHHIAGPLYRLHKTIEESVESKEFKHIVWRNRDFFPELADTYNKLADFFNRPR